MMRGLLPLYPSGTMIAAAPKQGAPAAGQRLKKFKKTPCPAVPRRGPEAGVLRIEGVMDGCKPNRFASVSIASWARADAILTTC